MKLTNKILEAVNRGIQLALDDFDDNDNEVQNIKSKQVQNRDYTKEYLDIMKDVVDLGLPSGTLWRKCNLGAENEYDCGSYYAWGELKPKSEYTYTWESEYTYTQDNYPTHLPSKYDVATQILGNYYSIPTKEQCEELIKYTECKWVNYYKGRICGCLFIGKNGNQLFIPAAGEYAFDDINGSDSKGTIWTSVPNNGLNYAWCLTFNDNDKCAYMCINLQHYGMSIRPVVNL